MSGSVVVALLAPPVWTPPWVDPVAWRVALAEDVVDLISALANVDLAIAAPAGDLWLATAIGWPITPGYEIGPVAAAFEPEPVAAVLAAAQADGYERAVVICADAPDLPALLIGKLLAPLTSRSVVLGPAIGGGLFGLASVLPAPAWLPEGLAAMSRDGQLKEVHAAAGRPTLVATAQPWHRLRTPGDLDRLDRGLEGWDATRALLDRD